MSTATLVDAPPAVGTKMRQVVVESFGGPDRLTLVDTPVPEPVLGEVRVRTVAAGVSYPDILIREGTYPGGPRPPLTPGYDIVGVVDKLGPGAGGFAPGDMVAAITVFGSYAEALCIPQEHLVAVPQGIEPANALCLAFNYITAYQMLTRTARARRGQRVLVHGGAGGIGTAALEIGRLIDLEMYGTATDDGCRVVADLGATPIDYKREDFVERVRALTGNGVDLVLDGIGGTTSLGSYRALAPGGRLIMFGNYATLDKGRRTTKSMATFYATGAVVFAGNVLPGKRHVGIYQSAITRDLHPDWYREDLGVLFRLHLDGYLHPLIAARMPLSDVKHAHELLAAGGVRGKLVLFP